MSQKGKKKYPENIETVFKTEIMYKKMMYQKIWKILYFMSKLFLYSLYRKKLLINHSIPPFDSLHQSIDNLCHHLDNRLVETKSNGEAWHLKKSEMEKNMAN